MDTGFQKTELELILTRVFDAPLELVYTVWTEPKHVAQWFGPHGMKTPVVEMDFRPGGKLHTVMVDQDGKEYPTDLTYLEIVPNQKIVFKSDFNREGMPTEDAVCEVTFVDHGAGKTRIIVRWSHATPETRQFHEDMGFEHGWGETLERMEAAAIKLKESK
jgi:uncharacterized protein YndB with AHSA1/START domain